MPLKREEPFSETRNSAQSRSAQLQPLMLIPLWLLAIAGLYGVLLAVELDWNLFDWRPQVDLRALALGAAGVLIVLGIWFLARFTTHLVTRIVSLLACLALLGLGVYVLPPEPKGAGLFARDAPSPVWYRGSRLGVMSVPTVFWFYGWLRNRPNHPKS